MEGNSLGKKKNKKNRWVSNQTLNVLNPTNLRHVVAGGLTIRGGVCSRVRPLPLGKGGGGCRWVRHTHGKYGYLGSL